MAVGSTIPLSIRSVLGVLVTASVIVWLILYREKPEVRPGSVFSVVPWTIVAASFLIYSTFSEFPHYIKPVVSTVSVSIATIFLFGFFYLLLLQLGEMSGSQDSIDYYVGALGSGLALILVMIVILLGGFSLADLLWLTVIPIIAGMLATMAIILFTMLSPDVAAYTGIVGWLAVKAHVLAALTTAVRLEIFGSNAHTPLTRNLIDLSNSIPFLATVPFGWEYVILRLLIVVILVSLIAPVVRDRPELGYATLGVITVLGIYPAVYDILRSTLIA